MKELKLLEPEVVRYEDGTPIRNRETRRIIVNKKCQIINKDKKSKAKSYFVQVPIYNQYLKIKEKQKQK
jgi:hypothetical protein